MFHVSLFPVEGIWGGGGGGGVKGVHNNVLYGEAPPQGPNPYPFTVYTIFDKKGHPFI